MITANVHDAKTNLSKLLAKVAEGEQVMITNRGKPVAQLVKPKKKSSATMKDVVGSMKGKIHYAPDYDQADQEILDMFEESIHKPL